jgi:hypothetical protein
MSNENDLHKAAFEALKNAEKLMYEYACSLDLGEPRIKAFEIYENIRLAAAVWR